MLNDMIGLKGIIVTAIAGLLLSGGAYFKGREQGILKGVASVDLKCPDCSCPKYEPCPPQIDLDKVKGRNIDLTLKQTITYNVDGDSVDFRQIIREEMEAAKLVKCRK